jgi:hypothetical protein
MLLRQTSSAAQLPVAPRPFHDEALGGWIGRLAAQYGISVAQMCTEYCLPIPLKSTPIGWLLIPRLPVEELERLAWLTRIDIAQLHPLQSPSDSLLEAEGCLYCSKCLFLNPVDVFSPYWKRQWFRPSFTQCNQHPGCTNWLSRCKTRDCKNFDSVLEVASLIEQKRYQSERSRRRYHY